MGLSGRKSRRNLERRRKVWGGVLKSGLIIGFFGAIGYYAYAAGLEISLSEVRALEAEVEGLQAVSRQREDETSELRLALESARQTAADYEERYLRTVPSPEVERLVVEIRDKLAAGVKAERLAAYIAAADQPRHCDEAVTKRFVVQTHLTAGDNAWVRFANVITVTADGVAAQSGTGAVEHWYDPSKPVTVKFTMIGGKEHTVSGVLPLQYALISDRTEYRFTVTPGSRGFAEVSGDACTAE